LQLIGINALLKFHEKAIASQLQDSLQLRMHGKNIDFKINALIVIRI
jgi:hypothetical protein